MNHRPHLGNTEVCPHCGSRLLEFKHSLTRGLLTTLRGFARSCPAGQALHPEAVSTDYSQRSNFQKLRYWLFVRRAGHGLWELTPRGHDFIFGNLTTFKNVWTYRGRVVEYEGEEVNRFDIVASTDPFWQQEF